jgi:hypothetical protein
MPLRTASAIASRLAFLGFLKYDVLNYDHLLWCEALLATVPMCRRSPIVYRLRYDGATLPSLRAYRRGQRRTVISYVPFTVELPDATQVYTPADHRWRRRAL